MNYQEFKEKYLPVAIELEKIIKTYKKSTAGYADVAAAYEFTQLSKRIEEILWSTMSRTPYMTKRENLEWGDVPVEIDDMNIDADMSTCAAYAVYNLACELRGRTMTELKRI